MIMTMKRCAHCGVGALERDAFCAVCGERFPDDDVAKDSLIAHRGEAPGGKRAKLRAQPAISTGTVQQRHDTHARQLRKKRRMRPSTISFVVVIAAVAIMGAVFTLANGGSLADLFAASGPQEPRPVNFNVPSLMEAVAPLSEAPEGYTPIRTKEELLAINRDLSANYILMNDIDLACSVESPWTPIGASAANYYTSLSEYGGFSGVFDGNGYSVTGLVVSQALDSARVFSAGLFAMVMDGTVKNLAVSGDIHISGEAGDYTYAGGIAGVHIASERGSKIANCAFAGRVSGAAYAGGLVGMGTSFGEDTQLHMTHCKNIGVVSGGVAGGVIGFQSAAGALSGIAIRHSANYGTVESMQSGNPQMAGGIAGGVQAGGGNSKAELTGCSNAGAVAGGNQVGGIVGRLAAVGGAMEAISHCINEGDISGKSYLAGIAGACFTQSQADSIYFSTCVNDGKVSGGRFRAAVAAEGKEETYKRFAVVDCYFTARSGCKDARSAERADEDIAALLLESWPEYFVRTAGGRLPSPRVPALEESK